jgi:hypothetical protein
MKEVLELRLDYPHDSVYDRKISIIGLIFLVIHFTLSTEYVSNLHAQLGNSFLSANINFLSYVFLTVGFLKFTFSLVDHTSETIESRMSKINFLKDNEFDVSELSDKEELFDKILLKNNIKYKYLGIRIREINGVEVEKIILEEVHE